MLSHISMVIYFTPFESGSCLMQASLRLLLTVWGVREWKTAVNCIDKKLGATIWAAGVQYEGWLIDWDPGVMQAEGHKHTNTQWYLCYINRRGARRRLNQNNDFQLTSLSHTLSAIVQSPVVVFHGGGQYFLSWLDHGALHQSVQSMSENRKKRCLRLDSRTFSSKAHSSQTWTHTFTKTQCHQPSFHF